MNYTIYNPDTGQIQSILMFNDPDTAELNLKDKVYLLGSFTSEQYYVENDQATAKPDYPGNEQKIYLFDYETKSWILTVDRTETVAREQRDLLLSEIDRVNPVWYATLSTEQQTALIAYRQALLDVPQQTGFPATVTWPTKPTWL